MTAHELDIVAFLERHKLPKSHRLQPLFEAIENAFQAIEERAVEEEATEGMLEITVHRKQDQRILSLQGGTDRAVPLVEGFTVRDDGIGFGSDQWQAFNKYYTGHKISRGGKGVGRYSYLQAFSEARFESVYRSDGELWRRNFKLVPESDPTPNDSPHPLGEESSDETEPGTEVVLDGYKHEFAELGPKRLDALASHIGEHFFRRLIGSSGARCILRDGSTHDTIDLRSHIAEQILHQESATVSVDDETFTVTHYRCRQRVGSRHEILLCGNGRVVRPEPTPGFLLSSKNPLKSEEGDFYYVAYVESPFLDAKVEDHRLSFNLPEGRDQFLDHNEPAIEDVIEAVALDAKRYLRDSLSSVMDEHEKRIVAICKSDPILAPLLESRRDEMLALPVDLNEEQLKSRVRSIYHEWKDDVRERFDKLNAKVRDNLLDAADYKESYRESLKELNHLAKAELAGYVTDRKSVLDYLWDRMRRSQGRFQDEDAIHDIFFPRKAGSSEIAWDESNLWLIDERLTFSTYIASEKAFSVHQATDLKSLRRPDIAAYTKHAEDPDYIFGDSFVFGDEDGPECNSLCIIEFKRPGRTEFDDEDNPIDQVRRYVRLIRGHKAESSSGHIIRITESAPIWVFIVCHLSGNLEQFLDSFIKLPDGQGYIEYWSSQNAIVQVVTPEKLIADAWKRHRAFFEKLGIDKR